MWSSADACSVLTGELEELIGIGATLTFIHASGRLILKEPDGTTTVIAFMNAVSAPPSPGLRYTIHLNLEVAGTYREQTLIFDESGNLVLPLTEEEIQIRIEVAKMAVRVEERERKQAIQSILEASR